MSFYAQCAMVLVMTMLTLLLAAAAMVLAGAGLVVVTNPLDRALYPGVFSVLFLLSILAAAAMWATVPAPRPPVSEGELRGALLRGAHEVALKRTGE